MIRAFLGLVFGWLVFTAGAVSYGQWGEWGKNPIPSQEAESIILISMAVGAVLGLIFGLLSAKKASAA